MQTSHKLMQILFAITALLVLMAVSIAQPDVPNPAGNVAVSDQKAGALLVFPYYNSTATGSIDTRLTLTNTDDWYGVSVHLFFIDGSSCAQADLFVCLTPFAQITFKASEMDPTIKGYLIALAVNSDGTPRQFNRLIGNGYVNEGEYVGNYGAEAFWKINNNNVLNTDGTLAAIFFDGQNLSGSYDQLPSQFAVEIQSPNDAPGQRIITVGLRGNLTTSSLSGAAQVGVGQVINGNEKPAGSFSGLLSGNCRAEATFSTSTPRVPSGLGNVIPSGQVGTVKLNIGGGVGLLMTSKAAPNKWSGIRTLHKTATSQSGSLIVPVFRPEYCDAGQLPG